jgi:hypothetical protein
MTAAWRFIFITDMSHHDQRKGRPSSELRIEKELKAVIQRQKVRAIQNPVCSTAGMRRERITVRFPRTMASRHPLERHMYLRPFLFFLGAAALWGTTTAPANAAWVRTPCSDTRVGYDPECCYYGLCSSSRQCWVTETGIGVCAFVRYGGAQRRNQLVNERRR